MNVDLKKEKIHFMHVEGYDKAEAFADILKAEFGQASLDDATLLVPIGGDGETLRGLKNAKGRGVFGVRTPKSRSVGYWCNHGIDDVQSFTNAFNAAGRFNIVPIEATIKFSDGEERRIKAYNEIDVCRLGGQSLYINLAVTFDDGKQEQRELRGDGIVIATPLGSSGTAYSYNADLMSMDGARLCITSKGQRDGLIDYLERPASFEMDLIDPIKRASFVAYDGLREPARFEEKYPISIAARYDFDHPERLYAGADTPGVIARYGTKP